MPSSPFNSMYGFSSGAIDTVLLDSNFNLFSRTLSLSDLTESTSTTTGSGIIGGGLGVFKNIHAGGSVYIDTLGKGLHIKRGTNARVGTTVLVAGSATVANTTITANSIILITSQINGGVPGFIRVSGRVVGTSFSLYSSSGSDTSTIGWMIVESIP